MFKEIVNKAKEALDVNKKLVAGDLVWYYPFNLKEPQLVMVTESSTDNVVSVLCDERIVIVARRFVYNSKEQALKEKRSIGFPGIRNVFPSMIANEIVSVQPMKLPSNLVHYMDFSYVVSPAQSPNTKEEEK